MKMIVRIAGTWLLGLALILAIVDIANSAGQSKLLITSVGELWEALNTNSYSAAYAALETQMQAAGAREVTDMVFSVPAWGLFFVLGVLVVFLGRGPRGTQFVKTR